MGFLKTLFELVLDPTIDPTILPVVKQYQAQGFIVTSVNNGGASVTLTKTGVFFDKVVTIYLGNDGDIHVVS